LYEWRAEKVFANVLFAKDTPVCSAISRRNLARLLDRHEAGVH
jgi:hypothetical protein